METASIKYKTKWRSVNVAVENVQHRKCTRDTGFGSFLSGFTYRNL